MDEHHETGAVSCLRPLQHFSIARGIAEGCVGTLANEEIDADGLSGAVIDEERFGLAHECGFAIDLFIGGNDTGANDLFGWYSIGLLGIDADELLSAAGDDVGAIAVGSKVLHDLKHG